MTDPTDHLPRRYFVDESGRRVLIGLSIEETFEFETLDNLPALDESGKHVAWDQNGTPTTTRERRWLELYGETAVDRRGNSVFINQVRVT
jgi:hypothetical protein